MNDQILKLKMLSIAYQAANECDYCPEGKKAKELQRDFFGDTYTLLQLQTAFTEYQGERPDEIANKIISIIESL